MEILKEKQKRKLARKVWYNLNTGQPQKSADILEQAVKKYPDDRWLSLFYCEINSLIGNIESAIKKLNKMLKSQPDFSEGWALLGEIYSKVKKYKQATKAYEKALELNPNESDWLDSLVYLYFQGKKVKHAHKVLHNALRENPQDQWMRLLLAMTYLFDGKPQKAFLSAKSVVDECSGMLIGKSSLGIYALNLAGTCKMETEEYDEAISYFKEAIRINQNSCYNLAQCYFNLKYYNKAIKYCKMAIAIEPNDSNYWELLGRIYIELSNWDKAADALKKAISLGNNKLANQTCLCLSLYYSSKYKEALERCNAVLANNSGEKNILYLCACIYNKMNLPELALDYLEKALNSGFPINQVDIGEFNELEDSPRFNSLVNPRRN